MDAKQPTIDDGLGQLGDEGMFYVLGSDGKVSRQFRQQLEREPELKQKLDERRQRMRDSLKIISGTGTRDIDSERQ